jgi:hypothetical protein
VKAIYDLCLQAGIQLDSCEALDRYDTGQIANYSVTTTINGVEFWYIYWVSKQGELLSDYTVETERARFQRAIAKGLSR